MKIAHILSKREFAAVFEGGKKISGKEVALYILRETGREKISVGIVISKKFVPGAVKRNYLRRLIYAYFRENAEKMKKDIKVVVRVTEKIGEKKRALISKAIIGQLDEVAEKAGIVT